MPTRFNSNSNPQFGVPGLVDKTHQGTAEFTIPSVGLEDVDVAIFNLFDKELTLQVNGDNSVPKNVPVIFASGEKWAILKKRKALRDRNNSLILPLITIVRTGISQSPDEDITGRGINQHTGEIIIKRRLDKSDRKYQNLINRFLLKNQLNVATNPDKEHVDGQILTDRTVGEDEETSAIIDGAWLADIKKKNIYETIVIPAPQFYNIRYEVVVWTQYTQHMNQVLENIVASFLPQGNAWKLNTTKGYWFIARVEDNSYEPENNVDDMSQEERIIKYKFNVKVLAYLFATQSPGTGVPIKRYVSSPIIKFETIAPKDDDPASPINLVEDPFLGSDDPTLPLSDTKNGRLDQRRSGTRLYSPSDATISNDPALRSRSSKQNRPIYQKIITQNSAGKNVETYARVFRTSNASGETVIKPSSDLSSKSNPAAADTLLGDLTYETTK